MSRASASTIALILALAGVVTAFQSVAPSRTNLQARSEIPLMAQQNEENFEKPPVWTSDAARNLAGLSLAGLFLVGAAPAFADEIGRETEAPTLITGETIEICVKRGPLGACTKTELRTEENDNDKADKYFRQPTALVKRKDDEARTAESTAGNALIEKLKQQSEDNKEKNDLLVKQRTFANDASASFGPFDGQVLIMNENGNGFTVLENPQAMRLKKAGFIKGKQFIKQPTQQEMDDALEADGPGLLESIFGGN